MSSIKPPPALPRPTGPPRARRGLALSLIALLAGCQAPACTAPVAALPLINEQTGLYVPIAIDGVTLKLLLDTGSTQSLLTSETTRRLGLRVEHLLDDTDVLIGFAIEGVGGRRHIDRAWPHRVALGRVPVPGVAFSVVWSRNTEWDPTADGILGWDILSRYDLDLDVGRSLLTLYEPGGLCPPAGTHAAAARPSQDMERFGPHVTARIDGHAFDALIDTGAQRSSILAHAAKRLTPRDTTAGEPFTVYGVGTGHASAVMSGYDAVSVSGIVLQRLRLAVLTAPGLDNLDVILGTDALKNLRVWLSVQDRWLSLAYSQPGETASGHSADTAPQPVTPARQTGEPAT